MMLECSHGESLARAAFTHHDDKEHRVSKHYVDLKGLIHAIVYYSTTNLRQVERRLLLPVADVDGGAL